MIAVSSEANWSTSSGISAENFCETVCTSMEPSPRQATWKTKTFILAQVMINS